MFPAGIKKLINWACWHIHSHQPQVLLCHSLAAEDGRAGVLVRRRHGPVDVDLDAGVRGTVGAGEGDLVGGLGAAAAGDLELGARDVELSTTCALGDVQSNVLSPHQVAAGLDAAGDGDGERALACRRVVLDDGSYFIKQSPSIEKGRTIARPGELATKVGLLLGHLEPHGTVAVPRVDVLAVGDAGQVELHGARVVDVGADRVCHRGASCDAERLGGGSGGGLEAADLRRVYAPDETVVLPVVGPADMLPVSAAVDLGEGVVCAGTEGGAQDSKGRGQHDENSAAPWEM